jgi:hypothetical protein
MSQDEFDYRLAKLFLSLNQLCMAFLRDFLMVLGGQGTVLLGPTPSGEDGEDPEERRTCRWLRRTRRSTGRGTPSGEGETVRRADSLLCSSHINGPSLSQ